MIWLPERARAPELLFPGGAGPGELLLPGNGAPGELVLPDDFDSGLDEHERASRRTPSRPENRPRFTLPEILRKHSELISALLPEWLPEAAKRVNTVRQCRTAVLGGHLQVCQKCGDVTPAYNSCRDRHCPTCQGLDQERWLEARLARGLPVPYFHVVMTLPGKLRELAFANPAIVYGDLLAVAARVVLALAQDVLHGARSGLTALLHTWNSVVLHHPHAHLIVLGGGLDEKDEWVSPAPGQCLLPENELRARFQKSFVARLRERLEAGELVKTDGLEPLLDHLARPDVYWHAYAKRTLRGADEAFAYLARYASRVAISNSRILDYDGSTILLAVKRSDPIRLTVREAIRRVFLHVLPTRFFRIRYYGIVSPRVAKTAIPLARASLERQGHVFTAATVAPSASETWMELYERKTGVDLNVCARCEGRVVRVPFVGAAGERALRERLRPP